jgi:DnaK suppressor protein
MMAAKKSAPKSAKTRKAPARAAATAATRSAAKKATPRKATSKAAPSSPRKAPTQKAPPLTEKTTATLAPEVRVLGAARVTETADDGDAGENLLSGPRNVQAYVIKRGEQYMSREQLDHFRMILQNWKQDLMLEVDRTVSHMKDEAANFPDPNDRATQEEEFSLELRTRDRERKLIRKIDESLAALDAREYGYCESCGVEIGLRRLEARPTARLCIECKTAEEREEKQRG